MKNITPSLHAVGKKLLSKAFLVKASSAVVTLLVILFVASQLFTFLFAITNNWSEFVFTFEHPALVKQLHSRYDEETANVEKSLLQEKPITKDQLIQALTTKLQEQSK